MAKKKGPPKKWKLHTLKSYERETLLEALEDRILRIDLDLATLKEKAYEFMEPVNADTTEHSLRRVRAEICRVRDQVRESDRVTLRTEKKGTG